MRTEPVRTVTLPHVPPEPQTDALVEINELLRALSLFQMHLEKGTELRGLPLHGMGAVRAYFYERFKEGM